MDFKENLKRYLCEEEIEKLFNAQVQERTNSLILNTKKITKEEFIRKYNKVEEHPFLENVFYYDKNLYPFGKSYEFDNGEYYIMDASSLLISHFLKIEDHDLVLDMCAAPGGKTISLILNNLDKRFSVISNDISYQRSLELSSNIEHLGFDNVLVTSNDFGKIYQNFYEKFDKIILDAPCSGSSMFRKNKLAKEDWSIEKVNSCAKIQKELIEIAYFMLKKGGIISYSTCSFSYEENEEVVNHLLNNHSDMHLLPIKNENGFFFKEKDMLHIFPHLYKGEGQFLALLKKDCETSSSQNKTKNTTQITHKDLLKEYNLNFSNEIVIKDTIYLNNFTFNYEKLNLIRPGLEAFKINKKIFTPTFALAHYLSTENSIKLNEDEKNKYVHGEEIKKDLNLKNGYYTVSFENLNLGYVKYVDGKLKNFYPKGLRH